MVADLLDWTIDPYRSGWGFCYSFDPPDVMIEPPLQGSRSRALARGEQLLFLRRFEGYDQKGTYVEVLQKFLHVFGLHFVDERNAYCWIDKRGDLEDVISINRVDDPEGHYRGGIVVTVKRQVLDEYMAVTDTCLVRVYDITRFRPASFGGWSREAAEGERQEPDLYYRYHIEDGRASYMRGVQIVRSPMARVEVAAKCQWVQSEPRQYESFLAVDRKNGGILREISTEPGKTANYFVDSPEPWEVSPAFSGLRCS